MFIYVLRIILLFWIFSILIRGVERFFSQGRTNPTNSEPHQTGSKSARSVNEPPDLDAAGTIVDAEFVDIDGDE